MAGNPQSGIVGKHPFQPRPFLFCTVGNDHHPSVQGIADAHAATVVKADPTGSGDGVDREIE